MYLGPESKRPTGRLSLGRMLGGQGCLSEIIEGCQLRCLKGRQSRVWGEVEKRVQTDEVGDATQWGGRGKKDMAQKGQEGSKFGC